MNITYQSLVRELKSLANPKKAQTYQRFFKTGPGEYGEGDIFLGIDVGTQRKIAKKYKELGMQDVKKLLTSPIHEYRFTAVILLNIKFNKASEKEHKRIVNFYLKNRRFINNWDLVDSSAEKLLGKYLLKKDRHILYEYAVSDNLWDKRIAIIATHAFIKEGKYGDTLKISKMLLKDDHDLIHKAVGWMLREVGKKDEKVLTKFLDNHTLDMPRTMLRYSIERFPEKKRKYYLHMKRE